MNAIELQALALESNKNYYENTLLPEIIAVAKNGELHICVDIPLKHYSYTKKRLEENGMSLNNTRSNENPYTIGWS